MPQLTLREKIEICSLGDGYSSRKTAALFNARHPERPENINQRTVSRIKKQFRETGSLERHKRMVRQGTAVAPEFLQEVHEFFTQNPRSNIRFASIHLQKNRKTVMKALKNLKFIAYKARFHQVISPNFAQRRLRFCNNMRDEIQRNPGLERRILWSDESWFKITDRFNRQNNR